jgi:multidrug efflux pump subunit AcrA (membrane-fusion protein)
MSTQSSLPLFRKEALEHGTQHSFLSHVILTTPIHFWASTTVLMGFTAVGLCLSAIVEIPRSTELPGRIETAQMKKGKLFAQLLAHANTLDTFHPGQKVQVKYDAFPFTTYGVFEGRVKAISSQPVLMTIAAPSSKGTVLLYPLEVELKQQQISSKGKLFSLRSGMTLTATIVLERKTLFNWLLEPLTGKRNDG